MSVELRGDGTHRVPHELEPSQWQTTVRPRVK
jgi:hypothetical protein